jgi:hypothetical protein
VITLRKWSDHVWAFYIDDGNPFGGRLACVTDSRENAAVDEQLEEVIWPEHRRPPDSKGVA